MLERVLSSIQQKWTDLCRQAAISRFQIDKDVPEVYNQKGGKHGARPTFQDGKWMKGKKEIVFIPDVPRFILNLALRSTSQAQPHTKASIVKKTMNVYTGFSKEDLESLLGIALNGILIDHSQIGKGTIRPSTVSAVPISVQTSPLRDLAILQPQPYSQHHLGRPRWTEGLRVRSSWAACGDQVSPKDEPSTLDLELAKNIASYSSIIVVVGAGISVAAGVPDFRSKAGLFAEHGREVFSRSSLNTDAGVKKHQHAMGKLAEVCMAAIPAPLHHLLAMFAETSVLRRLWTYNIDELDTRFEFLSSNLMSNSKFPLTIQMHGGLRKTICTKCSLVEELLPAALMDPDPDVWDCTTCRRANAEPTSRGTEQRLQHVVGRKSANIVLYDDPQGNLTLVDNLKYLKKDATAPSVDAVLVVGLSATLPSAQQLVRDLGAKRARKLFWINKVPPPKLQGFDKIFQVIALTDCQLFATEILRSTNFNRPCFD